MEDRSTAPMGLDLTRLRSGEITAVAGALVVLLGLFMVPWYAASHPQLEDKLTNPGGSIPAEFGAWSAAGRLGLLGDLVILAAAIFAIGAVALGGRGIELDGSGSRLLAASLAATAVVVLRMAFTPTSLSGYEFEADLRLGIFVTLAGTITLVWASWRRLPRRSRAGRSRRPLFQRAR